MPHNERLATIVIPTFRRPDTLRAAVASAQAQVFSGGYEILVIDNDPEATARGAVSAANLRYIHCPQPGVANARNAAMAALDTRFVAFLDDDQTADPHWLAHIVEGLQAHNAGIAYARLEAVFPDGTAGQDLLQPLFSRTVEVTGIDNRIDGAGGSALDLSLCDLPDPVFDPAMNETGGEDDRLFSHLIAGGTQVVRVREALVYEHVPAQRITLEYVTKRYFAFGQGPSQYAADKGVRGWPCVAFWMSVGVGQTLLRLPRFAWHRLTRSPNKLTSTARLMEGLGKVFWSAGFKPRLYGAAAIKSG